MEKWVIISTASKLLCGGVAVGRKLMSGRWTRGTVRGNLMSPFVIPAQSAAWGLPLGCPGWIRSIPSLETPVPDGPQTGLPHTVVSSLKTRTRSYLQHNGPRPKCVKSTWAPPHRCSDLRLILGLLEKSACHLQTPFRTCLPAPLQPGREAPTEWAWSSRLVTVRPLSEAKDTLCTRR